MRTICNRRRPSAVCGHPSLHRRPQRVCGGIAVGLLLLLVLGCTPQPPQSTMTSGHAVIGASEAAFRPAWSLSATFQAANRNAFIDIVRRPTMALVDSLLNKRVDEVFLDRPLMPAETLAFASTGQKLLTYPVAYYPVYLLVAKDNPVESIDSVRLRKVMTGEVSNWRDIGGDDRRLTVYMPPIGEGAAQSIDGYFGGLGTAVAEPCSTLADLVSRGKTDTGGLTIYPAPIDTIPLRRLQFEGPDYRFPANVETICSEPAYPFRIELTYVTTHNKDDVAAGYLTYAVGNHGQRDVMRLGYRPAAVPVRVVKMR